MFFKLTSTIFFHIRNVFLFYRMWDDSRYGWEVFRNVLVLYFDAFCFITLIPQMIPLMSNKIISFPTRRKDTWSGNSCGSFPALQRGIRKCSKQR